MGRGFSLKFGSSAWVLKDPDRDMEPSSGALMSALGEIDYLRGQAKYSAPR